MRSKLLTILLTLSMLLTALVSCNPDTPPVETEGGSTTQATPDETTEAETEATESMTFDITDYGAVGDGVTDCTAAVQAALDDAGRMGGTVIVPSGRYLVGQLKMYPHVRLEGDSAWSFDEDGGSVFLLNDPSATCMIDITGAFGCTITGMCLNGQNKGEGIHGVYLNWPEYNGGGNEDTPTVEDCRIGYFTGDGVHLSHVWCFSIRHNMICFNNGSGLYIDGWDGFILDNWFSANSNCGIYGGPWVSALTITGNRVEWNSTAGIWFNAGDAVALTGNYFDRSFGPGVKLGGGEWGSFKEVSITGNTFRRSGSPDQGQLATRYDSSHLYMKNVQNITVTGNSFKWGTDDNGGGTLSPDYDVYLSKAKAVIIANNTMYEGSLKKSIITFDCTQTIIENNPSHHDENS